jgi:hypothetical protein
MRDTLLKTGHRLRFASQCVALMKSPPAAVIASASEAIDGHANVMPGHDGMTAPAQLQNGEAEKPSGCTTS